MLRFNQFAVSVCQIGVGDNGICCVSLPFHYHAFCSPVFDNDFLDFCIGFDDTAECREYIF